MMDGITILAQEAVVETNPIPFFIWFVLPPFIGMILGAVIASLTHDGEWFVIITVIGLLVAAGSLPFTLTGKPTSEYTYKVTIEDTVSLTEFYERYEIIDQDGMIYEIRERNE